MRNIRLAVLSCIALVVVSVFVFFGVRAADSAASSGAGAQVRQASAAPEDDSFYRAFLHRQDMMRRFFDDVFGDYGSASNAFAAYPGLGAPLMNIHRTDKELVVTCDLPGMDKDGINVEVRDRVLTVSGERGGRTEETNDDKRYYVRELSYGKFSRSVMLPEDADPSGLAAEYRDGVLTLTVPVRAGTEDVRKVPVK